MTYGVAHLKSGTHHAKRMLGFTLLELMMTVAVVGLLASISIPSYREIIEKQKVGQAVRDLVTIAGLLEKYRTVHFRLPESLTELNLSNSKDPWGADYRYLNFDSSSPGVKGKVRKDHNLHPLNSEFDLYSAGPDGQSSPALTAKGSRDDVIWARDGNFVGSAKDY